MIPVADDWHASPDRVALVTGLLNGAVSAVASALAIAPRTPLVYSIGVLVYALFCGVVYAAFSAVLLFAIGRGVASTKYATLSSLGNIPVVYMTALDGWLHDRFGTAWMLQGEAIAGVVFVGLALLVLQKFNTRGLVRTA